MLVRFAGGFPEGLVDARCFNGLPAALFDVAGGWPTRAYLSRKLYRFFDESCSGRSTPFQDWEVDTVSRW